MGPLATPGRLTATGLVAVSVAVMAGLVLAANPARYGAAGTATGVLLIAAAVGLGIRLFRRDD